MNMPFIAIMSLCLLALGLVVVHVRSDLFKGTKKQQTLGVLAIVAGFDVLHWAVEMSISAA